MGRKTFDSIGKPLPDRVNIVVSREQDLELPGVTVVSSKEAAIASAEKYAELCKTDEVIIIGGEQIFGMFFDKVSCIYLTEIDINVSGDAVFNFDFVGWSIKEEKFFPKSKYDEYPSVFRKYERTRPFVARRAPYEARAEMSV
jgi:dihydrofolate reductase